MATSNSNENYRLRLPGPTAVPTRVLRALAQPMINHRGPEFRALYAEIEAGLQALLGTANPVLLLASSGTGVMEAALVNTVRPGERVLVVVNGQFGERFAAIAAAHGAAVDKLEVEWGRAVAPAAVAAHLDKGEYRALVVVHNESSTGMVADLRAIGELVRNRLTLLLVDSVSGLGGLEMRQDAWGVDIVVSASQKCLMCPPGLGVISVSARARARLVENAGFYWDLRRHFASAEKKETAFTPPVSLFFALREALAAIEEEGREAVLERHRRLSARLRAGGAALGLGWFGDLEALSPTVVVFSLPNGVEGGALVRKMYDRHRTVIAGSRNRLEGKIVRIGTMGAVGAADIERDLEELGEALHALREEKGHGG